LINARVIYLHGFASSAKSRKAVFFAEKLSQEGFSVEIPDLAAGDFEHLTISGQLQIVERLLADGPAILFGSSMGGYLAALAAARQPEQVSKVVLLAPAFGFYDLWTKEISQEKLETWRKNGTISVFHYGEGRELPLSFGLMEDAARFEAFPEIRQPGLLFQGVEDPLVPVEQSRRYVANRPNICLTEFRSGHELTDVLDDMWLAARQFLLGDL
jgi:pimeloyl-ACP methyl ester carboxylesterase